MIKLESIDAYGFKNLKIRNLIFPPEGNILIKGKNESGKSTLFEAIVFALTSKLLVKKAGGFQDAIAFDKETAVVELKFQKNGIPAKIRKIISRTTTGSSLYIYFWKNYGQANEKLYEGKSRDIDPIIEEFLGFDFDVLINSSFVKQKGLDEFSGESQKIRKKIINKLLNLEKLTQLQEKYVNILKDKKIKEQYIKNLYDIKKSKEEIDTLNKKSNELNQLKQEYDKYNEIYEKIIIIKNQIKKIINETNKRNLEIIQLEGELKEIEQKKSNLTKSREIIEEIIRLENKNKIMRIELSSKEKDKNKIINDFKKYDEQIRNYHKQKENLKRLKDILKEKLINLDKFREWEKKFERIENIEREILSIEKDIQNLREKIKEKIRTIADKEVNLKKNIKNSRDTILNNLNNINDLKNKLN
ncbi:MAG: AAA family ATPase, partial [Candidatus Helarchaeota archaeon]